MSLRPAATATLAVAIAILVPAAIAQMTQVSVRVDNKDYTVTEMRGGRASHMVQLAGPEGAAMVMVDNDNKITAFISPPGGGGQQDLINKVWAAYLAQKNGTAAAAATPGSESSDPNAALRAQAAAVAAQAQARARGTTTPAPGGQRAVKTIADDSITVYDPTLNADVTFTENLMKAEWS